MNKLFLFSIIFGLSLYASDVGNQLSITRNKLDNALSVFDTQEATLKANNYAVGAGVNAAYTTTTVNSTGTTSKMLNEYKEPNANALTVAAQDPLTKRNILEYLYSVVKVASVSTGTPQASAQADKLTRLATTLSGSSDPEFKELGGQFNQTAKAIKQNDTISAQEYGQLSSTAIQGDINKLDSTYKSGYPTPQGNFAGVGGYTKQDQDVFGSILSAAGGLVLQTAVSTLTQSALVGIFKDVLGIKLPGLTNAVSNISAGAGAAAQQGALSTGNPVQTMTNSGAAATQNLSGGAANSLNQGINKSINPQGTTINLDPVNNTQTGPDPQGIKKN